MVKKPWNINEVKRILHIFYNIKSLDIEEIIPLNTVVMATRILNPILDKLDLIDESYMLDVYAKPKGEE